jgi:hypothetical protein
LRKTRHASGKKMYNKKHLYLTRILPQNTGFVPTRILFPKGEEHEDGQNWIEQFWVRFALQAQLFQGQAQRAGPKGRPKGRWIISAHNNESQREANLA